MSHKIIVESFNDQAIYTRNCQGFSTAGKRELHDPRNSLLLQRLAKDIKPKIFIAENL